VSAIRFYDRHPAPASLREEVLQGLARRPRAIPPKFFYDLRGSALFEAICRTPEYYPTRTEVALLCTHAAEIARLIDSDCLLVELGSGGSEKVRLLLEALRPGAYMPVDISRDHLLATARSLAADYPWLDVHAACIDYSAIWHLPYSPAHMKKVAFFPGSSIGNFEPAEAVTFLRRLAAVVGREGGVLIGVDLKKDIAVLNAAYNDAQGITAAFNLNLLTRINRELQADFDLKGFSHLAFYNEPRGRIEMHLVSRRPQTVRIDGARFAFSQGERIHTECSYKYQIEEFHALAWRAGLSPIAVWTDRERLFSLHYLGVAG